MAITTQEDQESDRAKALRKFLDLPFSAVLESDDDESYTVNPRKIKQGTNPKEYKECIRELKAVLTKRQIADINFFIRYNIQDEQRRDSLYYKIEKAINKTKNLDKKTPTCKKVFFYVVNVVYHLLATKKNMDIETVTALRQAWKGQDAEDKRELAEVNDGEYLVLTDSEADEKAKDYINEELWKDAVANGRTEASFEVWREEVLNMDGRGCLASYDSCENEETINGETYFIYCQNKRGV